MKTRNIGPAAAATGPWGEALLLLKTGLTHEGVEFAYPGTEKRIRQGIDATVPAGTVACIVGFSGAGKSTMLYHLTREHTETAGSVCFDSSPLSDVPAEQVRKRLSVVLQDSTLHNGTAADNIRMGTPGASQGGVEEAARRAECLDFISGLPSGYDTWVGEGGDAELSGGQRQRICVARALCRRLQPLVLDEATSALDSTIESAIIGTIARLSRN